MNTNKAIILIVIIGIAVVIFNVAQMGSDCSELRTEKAVAKLLADNANIKYNMIADQGLDYTQSREQWLQLHEEYMTVGYELLDCTT